MIQTKRSVVKKLLFKTYTVLILSSLFFATTLFANTKIGLVVQTNGGGFIQRDGKRQSAELKSPIFLNDKIITTSNGKVEILFEDDTTLTAGVNSDITIDSFVYGGDKKPQFGAKIIKGVSRVITGKIVEQNKEGFALKTPLSTVGIRGTIITVNINDDKESFHLNQIGPSSEVIISNNITQQEQILDIAGNSIDVIANSILTPRPTTQAEQKHHDQSLNPTKHTQGKSTNKNNDTTPDDNKSLDEVDDFKSFAALDIEQEVDSENNNLSQDHKVEQDITLFTPEQIATFSGKYTGNLEFDTSNVVGNFNFVVDLDSGSITNANINTANFGKFTDGSGKINSNLAFNIGDFDSTNDDYTASMNGNLISSTTPIEQVTKGNWTITPDDNESTTGSFHGWKER